MNMDLIHAWDWWKQDRAIEQYDLRWARGYGGATYEFGTVNKYCLQQGHTAQFVVCSYGRVRYANVDDALLFNNVKLNHPPQCMVMHKFKQLASTQIYAQIILLLKHTKNKTLIAKNI